MPEVIELEGSPAELLGGSSAENGTEAEPEAAQQDEHDDAASVVSIHTPPRQLSPEEKEERRQLIRKIGRYRALFPAELADVQTGGLDSMPLEGLRDLGQDVEFLVGTRRSAKAVRGLFIGGLQGVEAAGPFLGLELRGLANVAAASEDLLSTVDECAVRYESSCYVDPVARLGLAVVQLALAVDSHNRRAPPPSTPPQTQATPPATSQRVDNLAAEQFSDL
jgi:hypothetical protein